MDHRTAKIYCNRLAHSVMIFYFVLWSFSLAFFGPATITFHFQHKTKQWPHKQHHYQPVFSPVFTYEQNEILHSNMKLSIEKNVARLSVQGNNTEQQH
jgi:hypothetical protein